MNWFNTLNPNLQAALVAATVTLVGILLKDLLIVLGDSIQIALLLGMFSVAILAAEPVNRCSMPALASTLLTVGPVEATPTNSLLYGGPFQQTDVWALIKTDDGMLFVWNNHELHFTLAVKGKDIKQVDVPDRIFLAVDGKTLQIQAAEIRDFAPDAKEKKLDDKAVLAAHRDWESKYIGV